MLWLLTCVLGAFRSSVPCCTPAAAARGACASTTWPSTAAPSWQTCTATARQTPSSTSSPNTVRDFPSTPRHFKHRMGHPLLLIGVEIMHFLWLGNRTIWANNRNAIISNNIAFEFFCLSKVPHAQYYSLNKQAIICSIV